MHDFAAIPPRLPVQKAALVCETSKAGIHEFWTRAGEVKNLAREVERLKRQAPACANAIADV